MKKFFFPIAAVAQTALLSTLLAQGPMNTGIIQTIAKDKGTLTVRTEQSGGGPITYFGMDKAQILTVGGKLATIADLSVGQRVSVFYGKQGDNWVVSKVLIPEPGTATTTTTASGTATTTTGTAATVPVAPPVLPETSRAATDRDPTTVPANSAATDGDRTTRAPNSAATDGDRTTVPADGKRGGTRNNSR